jgi:hypothetical protein
MRAFCCSSFGSLMFLSNEIFLLFFKNISEPKEEQQSDLFGEKHQRAKRRTAK